MTKYLLDTNIYINFYDRYYRFNYFPSFWEKFEDILNSNVILPKIVVSENYQDMAFKNWVDSHYRGQILNHKNYVESWAEVIQHIQLSDLYKDEALSSDRGWANESIADPWLLAIAKEEDLVIVTDERKNPSLNSIHPSKAAKIPDVAQDLGIRCITMNEFFGQLDFQI
ncbi:DUF4411 family protein [Lactococcus petauri]|uniref:DUF4411 family protein n=1 Tax=Lactococcus petauri TaxID=1940789 RepID=UPI0034D4D493